MDNATAIKLINKNEPGLIVEDAGSHLNLRRVEDGPIHSIMVPQENKAAPMTLEQETEQLQQMVMIALQMLPMAPDKPIIPLGTMPRKS